MLADGATAGACAGIGCRAAGRAVVRAIGGAPITGIGAVMGCASVGCAPSDRGSVGAGAAGAAGAVAAGAAAAGAAGSAAGGAVAAAGGAAGASEGAVDVVSTGWYASRIGHQALSTEFLSTLNCS